MTAQIASGQAALLDEHWDVAEQAFRAALECHDRLRLPVIHVDARIGLAYALLQQERHEDAWQAFKPAYDEVVGEQALGLLLLEKPEIVSELLDIVPMDVRRGAAHGALTMLWARWNEQHEATAGSTGNGLLDGLSEREYEVLAQVALGASNKHIARQLSLSLHTVKRHIANILDKLDCDSRGQAADMFRRAG
jgi:LuxR family maltose regulon positive regulatory protein